MVGRHDATLQEPAMTGKAVRPEDILADHENTKTIGGVTVRKASIAATTSAID